MSGARPVLSDLDFNNQSTGINVPNPVNPGDIVNFQTLNTLLGGLAWKDDVVAASLANVTIATAPATLDGVTLVAGDRVLLKDQTTTSENGIYEFASAGNPLVRTTDADLFDELESAIVTISEGTQQGTTFRQTEINGTINTDPVLWTPFGAAAPPASTTVAGLIEIATQAEVDAGTATNLAVTPETLANWSGRTLKYQETFGTAVDTTYTINHNLNTLDVQVEVWEVASGESVTTFVRRIDPNNVEICTAVAPGASTLRTAILA
jgi:hypothetical protein